MKTSHQQIYQSLFNNSTREVRLHVYLPISKSFKIVIPFNVLFPTLRVKSNGLLIATFVLFFFCLVPSADGQNLSKKATVICHDEKSSPTEKHLYKGTLES